MLPTTLMVTSSNGNIFRVTGHLCGEFTGPGEFPTQRPVTQSFEVFFDLCLNKWLSKQWWGWWFETPSHPVCRHRNAVREELPSIRYYHSKMANRKNGEKPDLLFHQVMSGIISCDWYGRCMTVFLIYMCCVMSWNCVISELWVDEFFVRMMITALDQMIATAPSGW